MSGTSILSSMFGDGDTIMDKDKQEYVAKLEKAISQKYGDEAINNPKRFWNEEKEQDYLAQSQEETKKFAKLAETQDKVEEDGFLTNVAGDGLYYLVEWDSQGRQSIRGTHQYGSATLNSSSPHYSDQVQDYVDEKLHDPLFAEDTREDRVLRRYSP